MKVLVYRGSSVLSSGLKRENRGEIVCIFLKKKNAQISFKRKTKTFIRHPHLKNCLFFLPNAAFILNVNIVFHDINLRNYFDSINPADLARPAYFHGPFLPGHKII